MNDTEQQSTHSNSSYAYTSSKYWCATCRRQFSQLALDNTSQARCPRCASLSNRVPPNSQSNSSNTTTNSSNRANQRPSNTSNNNTSRSNQSFAQPNQQPRSNAPNFNPFINPNDPYIYYTQPMTDPFGRTFFRTFRVPADSSYGPFNGYNNYNYPQQNTPNNQYSNDIFSQLFGNFFGQAPTHTQDFDYFGSGYGAPVDEATLEAFLRDDPNNHGPPPAPEHAIKKLQEVKFDGKSELATCPVCQEDYKQGETLVRLPCKHDYHRECVEKWLVKHNSCPMCRVPI